ncbi:VaFE repeat-containing surface-anchored protein [Bariatricus massiliensis]|uniref:VaFE repeat-containing surface-anchored protein n=1 Tax=Bariatricus massiliensis TaxID=1745713 RepID=A0ABS8DGB8_9FIRM|nr:VaFE repeat-containing surface-anchored protein [Bariatricus massiliensis]MCB7304149.1 VaFE repeat-containing surface-anchored protein [Bariatricus massiliensis]MCB7374420.1 VaFE repeat-containing surface-anchored protein [Bariatricus massiliensis]MCB7387259.1 VaFE repeat-containing surface-anchored protein [Bariatricus massiliensis]MCB7411421.1 VaFE repeat-containing surface-anchored protein [Bariatricus massiliensis]MCQ5252633.1 VaFE repeat-containing surface-anchored protein [Bariatricus
MKKIMNHLLAGVLSLAAVFTTLPASQVQAAEKQYWTDAQEKAGYVEKVMNDGSIGSTFHEGIMQVEGETAYCIDINTDFQSGYKTRSDASSRMSADQIADVALSLEYVKQYAASHKELNYKQVYLLEQCVVWQRLSVHLGWSCDNVRAAYDEVSKAVQDEVYAGAKAFVKANKGRYDCGGYIYSGDGQELGQFWAKLDVGNAALQKVSSNPTITNGNNSYSLAGATYGIFADKGCKEQLATLTTDKDGNTEAVEVKAGKVYIKELSVPAAGFQLDKTVYPLTVKAGETSALKVRDTPKVTTTLIELFKIDMETSKGAAQGAASLEGAEFVWNYYDGDYNKDNLPAKPTRTWTTKTVAEKGSDGTTHYITKLADRYKVSGDSFYLQNGVPCLPLGTLTVSESKSPTGYLLEGAYMQANGSEEQIKGMYLAQITEDGELAVLTGSNQYSVSDKVIRGGVKVQKRDLETKDTKPQGGATLKDTEFTITSLNENAVLVDGKLYNKGEVVKTILTGIDGIASTAADTLPYGTYRLDESKSPAGYLTTGAVSREFSIKENGKIVDLTGAEQSIYNQIKRGDIEGVKIGDSTHKRLADVPFRITSKNTGESHVVVTDKNGQFSTAADWVSHKQNTNRGKTSEDGIWFGISEPDDSKGALLYDTYEIEELRCDSNKGFKLIPAFEIVVSRDKVVIDLGTLTDDYEKKISIHTTAADKATGEKAIVAGKEVTIVDTVTLDGLKKGTKYQLKGWQMVKDENTELLVDGERVESEYTFTADGQTVSIKERVIKIHTTAADKATGEKVIVAGKEVTIMDTVTLDGLEVGTKYQLKGWQMVKDENTELLMDGKRVESDYTFTADKEEMKVEVAFTFNASALGGKNLVTFEELYDITNPDEPVKVTEHKDIEDEGQTVLITERIIKIHTNAASKDGEKVIEAGKEVTIVDTVTLDGLEVGTKYQLKGWQMVKDEKAELLMDGKRVENDYIFTAADTKMEVEIVFTFDASKLGGKQLVTFEELYDITNTDEPVKVTEHKDITDKGQTVTIKEVPETPAPEEPKKPETPDTPSHKVTDSPKTGDNTNAAAFAVLLGLSAASLVFAAYKKRRSMKHDSDK